MWCCHRSDSRGQIILGYPRGGLVRSSDQVDRGRLEAGIDRLAESEVEFLRRIDGQDSQQGKPAIKRYVEEGPDGSHPGDRSLEDVPRAGRTS